MGNHGTNWFDFITRNRAESLSGAILGGTAYGNWIFLDVGVGSISLVWEYVIRAIATIIVSLLSAIATAYGKDQYETWKQSRKLKKKDNERRKKSDNGRNDSQAAA